MVANLLRGIADGTLTALPLLAMGIFLAMFVAVLVRVSQRSRRPQYEHMASLPLEDDSGTGGNDDN